VSPFKRVKKASPDDLRDLTALDFSFVVPSKVCQTDISVAGRFSVTLRAIRERAPNLGRELGDTRWFTEAEILIND
jgi:hypothetical protein